MSRSSSHRSAARARSVLLGCALVALAIGCRKSAPDQPQLATSASGSAKPLDRLAPGELGPGQGELFGLPIPQGMTVDGKFKDFGAATGRVRADAVANYVREHVVADRVEVEAGATVFPNVRIKAGPNDRTYRVEVIADGPATRLVVRDITPVPPVKVEGLSTEELWRRAGFTPDGKPLNPKALE